MNTLTALQEVFEKASEQFNFEPGDFHILRGKNDEDFESDLDCDGGGDRREDAGPEEELVDG